jgi:hypothetical protein
MMRSIKALPLAALLAAATSSAQFCPGVTPWVFSDVPASDPFCGYITWMAQSGVTLGCATIDGTHRLYCPTDYVRRDQMAAFMGRLNVFQFPTDCAGGQVLKWNGSGWDCADDATGGGGGGGTVTSVAAGTGLTASPSPITTSGTLSVATGYRLPQACAANQVTKWSGTTWVCANDVDTNSGGTVTSLAAGSGVVLTPNPLVSSGTVAVDTGYVQRRVSQSCAVGSSIRAIAADGSVTCEADTGAANAFVQGGNAFGATAVLGTTDSNPLDVRVAGVRALRIEAPVAGGVLNLYGGYAGNVGNAGYEGQAIAGGGRSGTGCDDPPTGGTRMCANRVGNDYAFIGGGYGNVASGAAAMVGGGKSNTASAGYAMVAGGVNNIASSLHATVAGGVGNTASGSNAAVGGGYANVASGGYSSVPGGQGNIATGDYSFAAGRATEAAGDYSVAIGRKAKVRGTGAFSFADSNDFDFVTTTANSFRVRATGGVRFVVGIDGSGATTWSCVIGNGSAGWNCSSDRSLKHSLVALDGRDVLDRLAGLPLYQWQPKGDKPFVRHYGPMAQDFHAAFGLGDDETMISMQDADGVALAAIQGLHARLKERDATIARQAQALRDVQVELGELREAVRKLIGGRR